MKTNNIALRITAVVCATVVLGAGAGASAQVTMATVNVGYAGNAADTTGYGSVAYTYAIGTYEVTNAQYATFLNAVAATDAYSLYNASMSITRSGSSGSFTYAVTSGNDNKPVTYASFWDAARFANWLNNGQGGASTEAGSYTLSGVANPVNSSVTRNGGANWVVASENEWYKAAYYDPSKNGGAGGYWLYPTKSDTISTAVANYGGGAAVLANVGAYSGAPGPFGTFDQGGNAYEWNDFIIGGTNRVMRGGAFNTTGVNLASTDQNYYAPTDESPSFGFRVASLVAVPEPGAYAAVIGGVALVFVLVRRRRARSTL